MADQVVAKAASEGSYTPAPEGQYNAVCVDVIDMGLVTTTGTWGTKTQPKVALVFQIDEVDPDTGKRFEVAERFTVSMHEKATLRKFLSQWRGKSYSEAEAANGVPLDKLEGQPAVITVEHRVNGDKTYANILSIQKCAPGLPRLKPEGYVRSEHWAKKRAEREAAQKGPEPRPVAAVLADAEVDSLPF